MGDGTPSLGEKAQQLSIVSTSYYLGLYQQAWAASVETVFSSKDILRDHPSHRATIEDLPSILTFKYNDSDCIVRAEYLAAHEDILDMFTSASGVPTRPSSSNVFMSEMCTLLSAIESHDVNHVRRLGGVDINGLSGIGKSVFLGFVLIMRCLARLPTIFYDDKTKQFHIFTKQGVFYIEQDRFRNQFHTLLPENTWCLIDGAPRREGDIPWQVQGANFFTLFASSGPHTAVSYALATKISLEQRIKCYYMKTWTVAEIIAARPEKGAVSEKQLEQYMSMFSHNPRDAYKYAHRLPDLHKLWNRRIDNLSAFQLERVGNYQLDESIHHFIYTIAFNTEPQSTHRGCPDISMASDCVIETIRTRIHLLTAHEKLSRGGYWTMNHLLLNPVTTTAEGGEVLVHYTADVAGSSSSLSLGGEGNNTFYIGRDSYGKTFTSYKPLPVDQIFPWEASAFPREAYSRDSFSASPSTACVYNASTNSAIVFEVTGSLITHNTASDDTELVDMLSRLDLDRIDYVVVTPDSEGLKQVSFLFPRRADGTYRQVPSQVWHLPMTRQLWIGSMVGYRVRSY